MSEEKEITPLKTEKPARKSPAAVVSEPRRRRRHRRSPSLFGPLLLIAVGAYFLLRNMGIGLPEPNWNAALRLWPLLLVFIGLNIIVRQVRAPVGTALSAMVTIGALAVFGYAFFGGPIAFLPEPEMRVEEISYAVGDATSARVAIDFSSAGGEVGAGPAGSLLAGTVSVADELDFQTEMDGDRALVSLDTRNSGFFFTGFNFDMEPWDLTLSPAIPLDLHVDISSGAVELDLADLQLEALAVYGSSGRMDVVVPGGSYPFNLDMSSGSATLSFTSGSNIDLEVDMSSGGLTLLVPENLPMRIAVDSSSGTFDNGRLVLVEGDEDYGVWESPDYDSDQPGLTVDLSMSSGSVTLRER